MGIEGPIRDLALSDLLQLLFVSRRSGTLLVTGGPGGRRVSLELIDGALSGASGDGPDTRLGRLLVLSGRITEAQLERALAIQRAGDARRIGEILVELGLARPAEVVRQLRFQIEEAVFDLLRWQEGHVHFADARSASPPGLEVRLATDAALMEAARRLDEWSVVTASAVRREPLPRLSTRAGAADTTLSLEPLEWEILAEVDGETPLLAIARRLGRGELEVARALYGLAEAGVLEVDGHAERRGDGGAATARDGLAHAEKALAEGRTDEAEQRAAAIASRYPELAAVHALLGRIRTRRGDWPGAIEALERSIGLDPLTPVTYFHLGRARVRAGYLEGAREALTTALRLGDGSEPHHGAAARMVGGLGELLAALAEDCR
jgi:tetratricopeptide (TPR) repeat protein